VIESSDLDQLDAVCNILTELDTLSQAMHQAQRLAEHAQSGLDHLPPTLERDALGVLIQHALYREQ
jgi:geranylgeranyl pyrophosphate synthase